LSADDSALLWSRFAESTFKHVAGEVTSEIYGCFRLRLERLRVEEEYLLQLKREAELERIRGPKPKWWVCPAGITIVTRTFSYVWVVELLFLRNRLRFVISWHQDSDCVIRALLIL